MGIQAWNGYYRFEPGVYAQGLFFTAVPFLLDRGARGLPAGDHQQQVRRLPADDRLPDQRRRARRASTSTTTSTATPAAPGMQYSDMNGYGHFLRAVLLVLALLGLLRAGALRRCRSSSGCAARRASGARACGKRAAGSAGRSGRRWSWVSWASWRPAAGSSTTPTCSTGTSRATSERRCRRSTRRSTGSTKTSPLPRITAVEVAVDIFPEERRIDGARSLRRCRTRRARRSTCCTSTSRPTSRSASSASRAHQLEHADDPPRLLHLPAGPAAGAGREDASSSSRSRRTTRASSTTARTPRWSATAPSSTTASTSRPSATTRGGELVDRNDRRKHGLPPVHRMAKVERPAGAAEHLHHRRLRLDRLRGDGVDQPGPDRDRAGLPEARVDGERPALLPLRDGRADPPLLLVPVGALRR